MPSPSPHGSPSPHRRQRAMLGGLAVLGFVVIAAATVLLATAASALLERLRGDKACDPGDPCDTRTLDPPAVRVHFTPPGSPLEINSTRKSTRKRPATPGVPTTALVALLLLDFESPASRQVFSMIVREVKAGGLGAPAALWVFHAPGAPGAPACDAAQGAGEGPPEGGAPAPYRCLAAWAVECAEALAPGRGIAMAGAAFDLQWTPEDQTSAGLAAAGAAIGIDGARLEQCILIDDQTIRRAVAADAAWAQRRGLEEAPAGWLIAATAGPQGTIAPASAGSLAVLDRWLTPASLRRLGNSLLQHQLQAQVGEGAAS